MDIGSCRFEGPGKMPSAELPKVSNLDRTYTIELERWEISNRSQNANATTEGLNKAIDWASENGYGTVRLPAGDYLVGQKANGAYTSGVVLPGNIHFNLDDNATIQMNANDTSHYCVIGIPDGDDVRISGGTIRGDRGMHVYAGGGTHEYGTGVCIGNSGQSNRILIEDMVIHNTTGDGIIVNDSRDYSQNITIRNNEIYNNRRQGISIIGGVNVVVENNYIHDIEGTAPQFGIDIESTWPDNLNRNILIRNNSFYNNRGGDYVNTSGKNVWLLDNVMDQGPGLGHVDAPIIIHTDRTGQVVRGNTVYVNSNGYAGLMNYAVRNEAAQANIIENNRFFGGGMVLQKTRGWKVTGNIVEGARFYIEDLSCLELNDNEVRSFNGSAPFAVYDTSGTASGNLVDGKLQQINLR